MRRFRFALQAVLDFRSRIVDERRRLHAAALRAQAEIEVERARLSGERDRYREALLTQHTEFDVVRLRATYEHLAFLDRAIDQQCGRLAQARAEAEATLRELVAADTDRNMLEKLKTHRLAEYHAAIESFDQREIDDDNARRFSRAGLQRTAP